MTETEQVTGELILDKGLFFSLEISSHYVFCVLTISFKKVSWERDFRLQ